MSAPPHYIHYYHRRFGLFRRFWWFAIGAGAASLWIRHKETRHLDPADPNSQRRGCVSRWRALPQPEQAPPYQYDWASHRPGLKASMPESVQPPAAPGPVATPIQAPEPVPTAAAPAAAPNAASAPAPAPLVLPAPTTPRPDAEWARLRRDEIERNARDFAAEKLERLSAAIDRLREGLKDQGPPAKPQDERWV